MNQTNFVKIFIGAIALVSLFVSGVALAQSTPSSSCLSGINLRVGSRGEEVFKLQQLLVGQGYLKVAPTGYFGPLTEQAVKDYDASGLCESAPRLDLISPNTSMEVEIGTPINVSWTSQNYSAGDNVTIVFRPKGLQSWVPSQNGAYAAIVKNDGNEVITPDTLEVGEYSIRVLCTDISQCAYDDSEGFITVINSKEQNTNASLSSQTQLASVLVGFQTLLSKLEELVR